MKISSLYENLAFIVSFNCGVCGEYGDAEMNTIDYAGNDINELAAEVVADDDPNFKLEFRENGNPNERVVGTFWGDMNDKEEDRYPVAVMYRKYD